jgi:hypothetical protein
MKHLLISIFYLISFLVFAQDAQPPHIPHGINYQAIARDDAGEILTEYTMTVALRIKDAPENGATVYTERYIDVMTDNFGLLHLVIGQGNPTDFADIDWTTTPLFLELTLDMEGEVVTLPATPFQAVPYAIAAGTSLDAKVWTKESDDAVYEDGNVGIGTDAPARLLHAAGTGDQFLRMASTSFGGSIVGLELTRGSAFSSTDFRMINDGGRLKFQSTSDNFTGESGDPNDNMALTSSGNFGIGTLNPESRLALQDPGDVGLSIRSTGTQSSYVDLLRGEGDALVDWRMVNRQGALSFRTGSDLGDEEGEGVLFLTQAGRMAVGNFSGAAEKIHVRGVDDQRIRVESTNGPASVDFYSNGQDFRMVNESGRLRLQHSGNSFGAADDIFDVQTDGTFRFRQDVNMADQRIVNVADPAGPQHLVNLRSMENYVGDYVGDFVANQLALIPQKGFFPTRTSNTTISNFEDCARRCHTLEDGGFDDWGVPSMEQLNQFVGDIDNISFSPNWTSTGVLVGTEYHRYTVVLATGEVGSADYEDEAIRCRCVR